MTGPLCLETFAGKSSRDQYAPLRADGMCARAATHEVTVLGLDVGGWSAKCERCARFYRDRRPLTRARRDKHELAQWRAGTLVVTAPELPTPKVASR